MDGSANAVFMVKSKVGRYVSAFLNSSGGCILFGVEDDGSVTGFRLDDALRVALIKVVDSAVGAIDPQVEVEVVTYEFAPVACAEGGTGDLCVLTVMVQPPSAGRRQPVYYLNQSSLEAWIRRAESLHKMDHTLVAQREADFADATGRPVARTWRHLVLRAIPFDEHIHMLLDAQEEGSAKVHRLWVFQSLVRIILDSAPPAGQLVCVTGQGGCGKSTLMATLCRNGSQRRPESDGDGWRYLGILGCHFCIAGAPQTLSARAFVDGVAASLASSPYSRSFKQRAIDRPIEVLRACDAADPIVAFRSLLRLCAKLPLKIHRRVAYVVDGLDEAAAHGHDGSGHDTGSTIPSLILRCAKDAPPWLVFVVTTRSEMHDLSGGDAMGSGATADRANGASGGHGVHGFADDAGGGDERARSVRLAFPGSAAVVPSACVIDLDGSSRSAADVCSFIQARCRASPQLHAFVGAIAAQLAAASGGNFQFARAVLDLAAEQRWSPEQVAQLVAPADGAASGAAATGGGGGGAAKAAKPAGLLERLYVGLFSAQFVDRFAEVQPLLELLLAARRNLSHDEISAALRSHFPNVHVPRALHELKPYLTASTHRHHAEPAAAAVASDALLAGGHSPRIALQHLSVRAWLTDARTNSRFLCSLARGHALMASHHLTAAHAVASHLWFDTLLHCSNGVGAGPGAGAGTVTGAPATGTAAGAGVGAKAGAGAQRDLPGSPGSSGAPIATQRQLQLKVAQSQRVFHISEAAMHLGQMHLQALHAQGLRPVSGSMESAVGVTILPELSSALYELASAAALASAGPAGLTAVHLATKRAHQPEYLLALELLLHALGRTAATPAAVLARSHHGKTALEHAAARGLGGAVAVLLRAADGAIASGTATREEVARATDAALWAASQAGSGGVACVECLLRWGAGGALPCDGFDARVSLVMQRGLLLGPAAAADVAADAASASAPLCNATGQTALFYAAKLELRAAAEALLRAPPPLACYCDVGCAEAGCAASSSPLYVAIARGDAEMAALLLEHGASPSLVGQHRRTDFWPRTPLCKACALGNRSCAETILRTAAGLATLNVAPGTPPSRVALLEATWALSVECVDVLLHERSIDALCAEADGACALHEAAYWGKGRASPRASEHLAATSILQVLIHHHSERGLGVDPRDCDGCTPLCYACSSIGDQAEWAQALLDAGASTAVRPEGGFNAHGWRAALDEQAAREAEYGRDALFQVAQPGSQPWGGAPIEEAASRGHQRCIAALLAAAANAASSSSAAAAAASNDPAGRAVATMFAEPAARLAALAAEAAAHGGDAPLLADDLARAGCTPAMVRLLLPDAAAAAAGEGEPDAASGSATSAPRFAERVHDDAPLAPLAKLPAEVRGSGIAPRPSRSPRTPTAIGPAAAALCPPLMTL